MTSPRPSRSSGAASPLPTVDSYSGVPGVAAFRRCRSQPFAEMFHALGYCQARNILAPLKAEFPRDPQPRRTAVPHWYVAAVHAISHDSLWVQSIGHIDALPPVRLDGAV